MLQNVMFDPKKGHTQAIGFPVFLMHLLSEVGIFTGAKTTIFLTSDFSHFRYFRDNTFSLAPQFAIPNLAICARSLRPVQCEFTRGYLVDLMLNQWECKNNTLW